jgi:hypothetical protein
MSSVVDGDNNSTLNLATRVESFAAQATAPATLQALSERMMGLEPTTFCMASRRSSQLSYIRADGQYSLRFWRPGPD